VSTRLCAAALSLLAGSTLGCISIPTEGFGEITRPVVRTGSFSVPPPEGSGWGMRIEGVGKVRFSRVETVFLRPTGRFEILVAENWVLAGGPSDPRSVADDFMSREVAEMRDGKQTRLLKLRRTREQVGGRPVHVMRYQVTGSELWGRRVVDGALYLWFPPEFATDRRFFLVLAVRWKESGMGQDDFEAAHPLVAGLEPMPTSGEAGAVGRVPAGESPAASAP